MKFKGIIYPSGSTVSLEIIDSLKNNKDFVLIGVNSHNNYEYNKLFDKTYNECPFDNDEEKCINYLLDICNNENCNFIIPTMDHTHYILTKNLSKFDKNNIKIISSSYAVNEICLSKEKTYLFFKEKIKCPIIYKIDDIKQENYPIFLKPKIGYGSKNTFLIKNNEDLMSKYNDDMLILEYLSGKEYTIDCISNNSTLMYFNIRERVLYKNGLSVITSNIIVDDDEINNNIKEFALNINNSLEFKGAWFFQVKFNNKNELKLLEISTRIAGASSINRLNGVNLILLSIYLHFDIPINILNNNKIWNVSKILTNYVDFNLFKKYNNIYIDFDDTLIINKNVNEKAISFIYKCINRNINLFLITRHKNDIYESLKHYKINIDLFKEIICVKDNLLKSDYIKENSILIDDSFKERIDCVKRKNTLIFDVDFFNYCFI